MQRVPYSLISAVQDLHEMYTRSSPAGPFRLELFHDSLPRDPRWPAPVAASASHIDALIRGISCLLGNNLAEGALPVIAALWKAVLRLSGEMHSDVQPTAEYYRFLSYEMIRPPGDPAQLAYRLFGEVLAAYLFVLADATQLELPSLRSRVEKLRRQIIQSGELPVESGSAGGVSEGA
ncbi:hypothetical protein KDL44_07000 [bacterium]|nr:hypothetical protein [bacterium]